MIASTSVSSATAQLPELVVERRQRVDVRVLSDDEAAAVAGRLRAELGAAVATPAR